MASAASSLPGAEETAAAADDAPGAGTSAASVGAPFGAFTPDEEKRFLTSTDGDKVEAMRRYKACLVRRFRASDSVYHMPLNLDILSWRASYLFRWRWI